MVGVADGDTPPPGVPGCGTLVGADDKNCGTTICAIITKALAANEGIIGAISLLKISGKSGSCWLKSCQMYTNSYLVFDGYSVFGQQICHTRGCFQ